MQRFRYQSLQERSVRGTDGTRIFYERGGVGTPLLFCDGLLCEGHTWKYLIPALQPNHDCLHWNYPGHGSSQDPSYWADLSIERLADDAAIVIDHAEVKGVTVMGHSLGVQVALELWHRHRDLISGLVLLCGSPGRIIESFHESAVLGYLVPLFDVITRFLPNLASRAWRSLPSDWILRTTLRSHEVNNRLIRAPDLAEYVARMNRVDIRIGLHILEGAGHHDATPYLSDVDVPTLVIAGEEDSFTPSRRSSLMASTIPEAQLMMVPGGTHSLPIEQPDLVILRVRRFLNER